MNILITGATGNTGYEVIRALKEIHSSHRIIAAASKPAKAKKKLEKFDIEIRKFDFVDLSTFNEALRNIDILFLLRPPHLADIEKHFGPFINALITKKIKKIVFLSVQGVEDQKLIPHHKLENLIRDKGFDYIFLRPSYFMQNLTTTLYHEIKNEGKIFIPSGDLKFTWVDVRDIGQVAARTLDDFERFKNQAFEITGSEQKDFAEVADLISEITGRKIDYESPSLVNFLMKKRKQGVKSPMIFVMIMLHFVPRLSKKESRITSTVKEITGNEPSTLTDFINRDKKLFLAG
jgi:uncharacterized protein YbjT (DUF2867 family)